MNSREGQRDDGQEFVASGSGARPIIELAGVVAVSVFLTLSSSASAEETKNYCHDTAVMAQWQKLVSDNPRDPIVVRLCGLCRGLCSMIDDGLSRRLRYSIRSTQGVWLNGTRTSRGRGGS